MPGVRRALDATAPNRRTIAEDIDQKRPFWGRGTRRTKSAKSTNCFVRPQQSVFYALMINVTHNDRAT